MNKLYIVIIISCILLTTACGNKAASNVKPVSNTPVNTTPKVTTIQNNKIITLPIKANINSFILKGWHIVEKVKGEPAKAEGDLNNDGIKDVALVIEATSKVNEEAPPRSLMILFGNKEKSYSLAAIGKNAVLLSNDGGVWGDPFESIKIDRKSLLISFYGGSNDRWFNSYRFKFRYNGFYLIGVTLGSYKTATTTKENANIEDYNLIIGDYVFTKANYKGKLVTTKGNRGKKKLVNLKEFRVNDKATY